MLNNLKYRLTHLNPNSWHRRLVEFAYWGKADAKKACPYWWFFVPASPFLAGFKLVLYLIIAIAMCLMVVIFHVVYVVSLLFGYQPKAGYWNGIMKLDVLSDSRSKKGFKRYKWPVRPITVLAGIGAVVGVYLLYGSDHAKTISIWGGIIAAAFLVICLMGLMYSKFFLPWLRKKCPPIEWSADQ